jgi:hypothetical protein
VNSSHSILGRPRHQTESAEKLVFDQVVMRALRGIGTLPSENPEIISVVGFGQTFADAVPSRLGKACGNQRVAFAFPI